MVPGVIVEPLAFVETLDRHEMAWVHQIVVGLDRDGVMWMDPRKLMKERPDLSRQNLWRARCALEARGFLRKTKHRTCFQVNPWLFHRSDVFTRTLEKQRTMWDILMAERYQDEFGDVDLEVR